MRLKSAVKRNTHYLRIKCVLQAHHENNAYYVRIKSVLVICLNRSLRRVLSRQVLQTQPLYVLDTRQNHITAAADHTGQGVNDRMQKNLHFFSGGGDGVDVQLVFSRHAVDLRDGIVLM